MNDADPLSLLPARIQLPRGRSALPADEVAESQRGRIMDAIVKEVAERGYAATSVQHVITRARVSRSAFYRHYSDKQQAFAEAYRLASAQQLDRISAAVRAVAGQHWRLRHRAGAAAYLASVRDRPEYSIAFYVEIQAAGGQLIDDRDEVTTVHVRALERLAAEAQAEDPTRPQASEIALLGAIAATDAITARFLRRGRVDEVMALEDPIVELQAAILTGGRL